MQTVAAVAVCVTFDQRLISDFSAIEEFFGTESTLKWLWEGQTFVSNQLAGCLQFKAVLHHTGHLYVCIESCA